MLFDGARTDLQLAGDFFIAATLHQQLEDFRIPYGNFDFSNVSHMDLGIRTRFHERRECIFMKSNCFAKSSPAKKKRRAPLNAAIWQQKGIGLMIFLQLSQPSTGLAVLQWNPNLLASAGGIVQTFAQSGLPFPPNCNTLQLSVLE